MNIKFGNFIMNDSFHEQVPKLWIIKICLTSHRKLKPNTNERPKVEAEAETDSSLTLSKLSQMAKTSTVQFVWALNFFNVVEVKVEITDKKEKSHR